MPGFALVLAATGLVLTILLEMKVVWIGAPAKAELSLTMMALRFLQPLIHADRKEFCSGEQHKNSHKKSQVI